VVCLYTGGGFGNKNQNHDFDLMAAFLAKQTGRAVKIEYTRHDDFIGVHGRWSTEIDYRMGARADGTLTAIDMNRAAIAWQVPLGEVPGSGLTGTGSENYGGPVVTAGAVVFIGATNYDNKFRAFDARTGAALWEATLPAAGNATPAVYEVDGKQYVAIAAGGGKWGAPSGGSYVAFALP